MTRKHNAAEKKTQQSKKAKKALVQTPSPYISVQNLSKTYKVKQSKGFLKNLLNPEFQKIKAVDDISFTIQKGEMVGFIGPNGAGKTTTIKMLCSVLHPDTGSITVNGLNPFTQRNTYLHTIGVVFGQKKSMWPELSVKDNFELIGSFYKLPKARVLQRVAELEQTLGRLDFLNQPFRKLSLGQQMKAELVANLLHKPSILFLDEPTIGMDIIAKLAFTKLLQKLNKTEQITLILTSHDLHEIQTVCNRMLIINRGKLLYDGDFDSIKPTEVLVEYIDNNTLKQKRVAKSELKKYIQKIPVAEFSVKEIPLEEVISQFYE